MQPDTPMTHTEDSLMALADDYHYANINNRGQREKAIRLAIREVLAERDSCAGQITEAVDQRDRQARRAEKAEAERDALAMQLKLKPAPMADCPVYCKTAVDLQAECERLREDLRGLEEVRREQAAGRDYWSAECERLRNDAARYRRLQILGVAPGGSRYLDNGTVLRFTNLDKYVDNDIAAHPSRGESTIEQALRGVCQ